MADTTESVQKSNPQITRKFIPPQKIDAQEEITLKPFNNSKAALTAGLAANSVADLEQWIASDLWKPFFDDFYNAWLKPQIDKADTENRPMSKGPEFHQILKHFAYEESKGTRKFTGLRVNKSDWEEIDHYAFFLHQVTDENERHIDGMLRAKQLTPDQRRWAMYQTLVYVKAPYSRSKRSRREKAKQTSKGAPRQSQRIRGRSPEPLPPTPDSGATSSRPKKSKTLLDLQASLPTTIVTLRDQRPVTQPLGQPAPQPESITTPVKDVSSSGSSISKRPLPPSVFDEPEQPASTVDREDPLSPFKRPRSLDQSAAAGSLREEIMQDRPQNTPQISSQGSGLGQPDTDPTGTRERSETVRPATRETSPPRETNEQPNEETPAQNQPVINPDDELHSDLEPGEAEYYQTMNTNAAIVAEMRDSNWDMTQRGWQLAALNIILSEYDNELHYNRVLAAAGGHDITLMDAATESWRRELQHFIEEYQTSVWIQAPEVRNEDLVQAREDDLRAQSLETERPNAAAAKAALNLQGNRPRLPGMPRSVWLRFWQVPAIHAIMEFQKDFTGCLLSDKMGLGKTITFVGHILQNIHERSIRIAAGERVPAKPKLILVPPNLVGQTVDKINSYTTNLRVLRYYDDDRKKSRGQITGILEKDSLYFDTKEERNANTVIVSSHATFSGRHGPNACKKWREAHEWTAAQSQACIDKPDPNCPFILHDCFDIIWVDEADALKRPDSRLNICMQWTNPDFIGLSTATPNRNSLRDSEGYLRLIQARQIKDLSMEQLQELGLADPALDPYSVPKNDQRALMRLSLRHARYHIFDICDSDPIKAGANMAKLNELIMLRRTHASEVDGQVIGESIPPLIRRRLEVSFSEPSQEWYNSIAEAPTRYLVTIDDKGKLIWNAQCFRKLVLYAMWPGFQYVEAAVYADTIRKWKRANNLLYQWLKIVHRDMDPDSPNYFELPDRRDIFTQIRILCQAAPKIRIIISMMEEVIRHRRKKAFWFLLPAEQLLVWDVLTKLGIDARMFSSDLSQDERDRLVAEWNNDPDTPCVLLLVFSMNSQGLDLQTYCNESVNVDIPMSRAILESADHRFRRVGQDQDFVLSWNLHVHNTIMDRQIQNNLRKALGNVMSELNSSIFRGAPGDELGQAGTDVELNMGEWVIINDKLVKYNHPLAMDARDQGIETPILDNLQIILQILREERGQWANIQVQHAPTTDRFEDDDDD